MSSPERYIVQIFYENQQAAIVAAERISQELNIVVDILHRREIATIHPPVAGFQEPPMRRKEDKKELPNG